MGKSIQFSGQLLYSQVIKLLNKSTIMHSRSTISDAYKQRPAATFESIYLDLYTHTGICFLGSRRITRAWAGIPKPTRRQENANLGDAYSLLLMLMKMKRMDTLLKFLRTCPHDADCTDVLCRFYSLFNHPLIQKSQPIRKCTNLLANFIVFRELS